MASLLANLQVVEGWGKDILYLLTFVLVVMEAFSHIMDANIEEMGFEYHPRCSEMKSYHISFADDLFIMAIPSHKSLTRFILAL